MKEKLQLFISLLISSICFFFVMNLILNEDILIVDSFNVLFFNIQTEELSLITLVINVVFYSYLFLNLLKIKNDSIKAKFDFFEFIFLFPVLIFLPYIYLLIFNMSDLYLSYTNILFLLYTSLLIFGFTLILSILAILVISGKFNKRTFSLKDE